MRLKALRPFCDKWALDPVDWSMDREQFLPVTLPACKILVNRFADGDASYSLDLPLSSVDPYDWSSIRSIRPRFGLSFGTSWPKLRRYAFANCHVSGTAVGRDWLMRLESSWTAGDVCIKATLNGDRYPHLRLWAKDKADFVRRALLVLAGREPAHEWLDYVQDKSGIPLSTEAEAAIASWRNPKWTFSSRPVTSSSATAPATAASS